MSALEQIERQLRDSVAARAHDADPTIAGHGTRVAIGRWSSRRRRPLLLGVVVVAIAAVLVGLGLTNAGTGSGPSPVATRSGAC